MKFYLKRGNYNYKEKRLITAIEKAIAQKSANDPNFANSISPVSTYEDLKALHDRLTTEDAEFEVVDSETDVEKKHKEFREGMKETVQPKPSESGSSSGFVDPFNDAEPIIRDYVMDDGMQEHPQNDNEPQKTSFDEPKSFAESFELPSADDEKSPSPNNPKQKKEKKSDSPVNPQFDDMSGSKKRRSTKKFARIIVEGVCILAEKGCIWWTTKDITEDKLVQYELEDKMDLQILLTLEDSQQITVREWFSHKVKEADTLFKVSKEDKDDLIDSLYEVMLEKGVAPTPMQELMINAVKTFVLDMGLKAFALNQQIKSVLNQLIQLKAQQTAMVSEVGYEAPPMPSSAPAPAPASEGVATPTSDEDVLMVEAEELLAEENDEQ